MTNKFWKREGGLYPHWEHMHLAGEGTFHRAIGDIPGCVPAVDIFIEKTTDQVRRELAHDPAWSTYLSGDNQTYARSPRHFVRNPSVPYRSL